MPRPTCRPDALRWYRSRAVPFVTGGCRQRSCAYGRPVSAQQADRQDRLLPVVGPSLCRGMSLHFGERHGLSYWDGAILVVAELTGCDAVCSEDMNPTQDYDGPRVINPFAGL